MRDGFLFLPLRQIIPTGMGLKFSVVGDGAHKLCRQQHSNKLKKSDSSKLNVCGAVHTTSLSFKRMSVVVVYGYMCLLVPIKTREGVFQRSGSMSLL